MADSIQIYDFGNWPSPPPTVQVGHGSRAGDGIKIWDLENTIYFKDATVLADTVTALGGDHLYMSPAKARQILGISTSAPFISATGAFDPAVTIWIDYSGAYNTHHYDPPIGGQWQVNRCPFSNSDLPSGFPASSIPFMDETHDWFITNGWTTPQGFVPYPPYRFQWVFSLRQFGSAYYNPDTAPPAPAPIMQRRWIEGFEAFPDGAGGSGGVQISRDSSRHLDGYGACLRNDSNTSWLHSASDFFAITTRDCWERGYVRLRKVPNSDGAGNSIARWRNAINGENNLRVNTTGALEIWTAATALMGTSPILTLLTWYKLDILYHYGGGTGTFQLYINGNLVIDLSGIASAGFGSAQNYLSTALGAPAATGALGLEIDMDDWVNAEIPPALTGMDWLMGSRIMRIRPTSVVSGVNWTGDFRSPIGDPVLSTNALISTATPSSTLQLGTDWHDDQLATAPPATPLPSGAAPLFQNGCAAAVLGWFCQGAGGNSTFRIRDGAGNIKASNVLVVGGQAFYGALYRPTGMITPDILGAVKMEWETGAPAGTNQVYMAHIQAEDLGVFGPEDINPTVSPPPPTPVGDTGIHNSPYPRSPWAVVGGMPQSNVFVAYGIYNGAGTAVTGPGADLNLPYPPCWLYVRPVAPAGSDGVRWWSSEFTAHNGLNPGINSAHMCQALLNPAFDPGIGNSIMYRAANSSQSNQGAPATTFQYVAFCDPGQRFNTNGAFGTPTAVATMIQLLRLAGFIPEAGFFNVEQVGTLTTTDYWYKGIGHTGAFASLLNAAETNNVVSFSGAGQLTTQTPLHKSGSLSRPQTAYSLWRTNDGISSGPSQGVVVAIASYVGDGNASRVIPLALGGRFPCFAQVTPHNALAWVRDPSHTGTTSCQAANLNSTSATAITAGGINSITVGITLNANGIVYDVFVLPGCSTTGWDNNGGDFCPLNYGGYTAAAPPEPYTAGTTVEGTPDLCVNDWDTPRADGLPYVPLMPGSTQDDNQ